MGKVGSPLTRLLLCWLSVIVNGSVRASEPIFYSGTSHWYETVIKPSAVDWTAARDEAYSKGGYLATIQSTAENDFVQSLVGSISPQKFGVWIGGTDADLEGNWVWITGEPWTYSNWASGEPNNGEPAPPESYLEFYGPAQTGLAGQWNDLKNSTTVIDAFVVEYNANPGCNCPSQADLDGSTFIDAVDLAVVIDIVFFGMADVQDPDCPATRSDFNDDRFADAVDLALLIDHVFFGGLGPVDPCVF